MTQQYLSNPHPNCTPDATEEMKKPYLPEPKTDAEWSRWALDHPVIQDWLQEMAPWQKHAANLTRWTFERLVVRDDAYGGYYVKDGQVRRCKKEGPLTQEIIANHFGLTSLESVIGLYTTSLDDQCKSLTIDLDRHDGEPGDLVDKNLRLALHQYRVLEDLGFHSLLIDSNGTGGLHLRGFFNELVPAAQVRAFGLWLVREWEKYGLPKPPEVFPKQDTIGGKYGNFVRLMGRHHHRQFLSSVWDGKEWRKGEDAIQIILSRVGDPASLIPNEALEFQPAPRPKTISVAGVFYPDVADAVDEWWKQYQGDLRTLDIVALLESKGLPISEISDREFEVECPWASQHTTGETTARILLADEDEEAFPAFHCFHDHCKHRRLKDVLALFGVEDVDRQCAKKYGEQATSLVISRDNPLQTAARFLEREFTEGKDRSLVHHHGDWFVWDGRRYNEIAEDDIRAKTWKWLASCSSYSKAKKADEPKLVPFTPTRTTVTSAVDALKAVANLTSRFEMPCWIGTAPCRPESVVAFANGLLDLDRYLTTGETDLVPHSPRWFSSNCLPHLFDPKAECPKWLAFLHQVFEGDEQRVRALAQWFGYNLTLDNRQQKFALLIGPPRSGKGTTMTVLTHLLGKQNVANPTLTSLGSRFGLAPLVGKQAAVVPDAHLGRNADSVAILEKLKSIVGCDEQNVDRKNKAELANVRINARFTIAVNELPRLPDASVSLKEKMVVIPYNLSFAGKEDYNLSERLLAEIPGVTNWALAGLMDLRRTGRLLQPKAGVEIVTDFVRLSSPLSAFIEDCCEVGPNRKETCDVLFQAWANWCQHNGHEVGSRTSFGTKLRAAVVGLERVRVRDGDKSPWTYRGLCLTGTAADRANNAVNVIG